jgi:hypothetical protein
MAMKIDRQIVTPAGTLTTRIRQIVADELGTAHATALNKLFVYCLS